jgi:hypothetical protein
MIRVTLVSAVQPGRCLEPRREAYSILPRPTRSRVRSIPTQLLTCLDLISANDVEIEYHIGFLSDVTDQARRCHSRIAATANVGKGIFPCNRESGEGIFPCNRESRNREERIGDCAENESLFIVYQKGAWLAWNLAYSTLLRRLRTASRHRGSIPGNPTPDDGVQCPQRCEPHVNFAAPEMRGSRKADAQPDRRASGFSKSDQQFP